MVTLQVVNLVASGTWQWLFYGKGIDVYDKIVKYLTEVNIKNQDSS